MIYLFVVAKTKLIFDHKKELVKIELLKDALHQDSKLDISWFKFEVRKLSLVGS